MPDYYGTIAGFRAYHAARDHVLPVSLIDDDEIASALLVASEWLNAKYRSQFPGKKIGGREMVLEWPRTGATDRNGDEVVGVPYEIENATYEAAAIQGANPGALSVNWTPRKYSSVSIDGAVSVTYATITSLQDAQTQFAIISEILSGLLGSSEAVSYVGSSARR